MVYFYITLKIYTGLIQNQKKSFIGTYIKLNSMNNLEECGDCGDCGDCEDQEDEKQLAELELENFLNKELDATLKFKEHLEKYVYDNYLPFLKGFNISKLRNIFLG